MEVIGLISNRFNNRLTYITKEDTLLQLRAVFKSTTTNNWRFRTELYFSEHFYNTSKQKHCF